MQRSIFHSLPDDLAFAAILALGVLGASIAFRRYALGHLERLAEKTSTVLDDLFVAFLKSIRGWGWAAIALASGVSTLEMSHTQGRIVHDAFVVLFAAQLGLSFQDVIAVAVEKNREREARPGAATTLSAMSGVGKLIAWAAVAVLGLSNLGVEVSALVAGLGVGGLAAAFAVQNVLGDLFAALSIYLDRPFDIGDSIQVDELAGVVDAISWRSTRLRSQNGEQIVFANGDLARARVLNYRRMSERRVVVSFRIPLDTSARVLEALSGRVQKVVEEQKDVRFERATLNEVGEDAFVFDLVFWSQGAEQRKMFERKHAVIVALHRMLEAEGARFAVPRSEITRRALSARDDASP
jgi:small-conductance mechanosensitive channel